jgi:hypothetical protein
MPQGLALQVMEALGHVLSKPGRADVKPPKHDVPPSQADILLMQVLSFSQASAGWTLVYCCESA